MGRALILSAALALLCPTGDADTSRRSKGLERVWRGEHGQLIRRRDDKGGIQLYWYGVNGRLVKTAGLVFSVAASDELPEDRNEDAWVHRFLYSAEGFLQAEIDCKGERRARSGEEKIHLERGTTFPDHRHVRETGYAGRKPAKRE